jgi:hypothetical protein
MKHWNWLCAIAVVAAHVADAQGGPICAPPGTRSGTEAKRREYHDPLWNSTRPHSLVGEVVNIEGVPLDGVLIRVVGPSPKTTVAASSVTGADGRFAFTDLPFARYVLELKRIGFFRQQHDIEAIPAGSDSICVRLRAQGSRLGPVGIGYEGSRRPPAQRAHAQPN